MNNPFLKHFKPFIPDSAPLRELSPLALITGTLLGIIFGASSLYLLFKTGLTVSASIPIAVISITLFRLLSRFGLKNATVLENNIVQTAGSAGESIAFGIGVMMPAIIILGFDLEIRQVLLTALFGGTLGILMTIPLRRALIRDQHGFLKFPEGAACAEVLKSSEPELERELRDESRSGAGGDDGALQSGKILLAGFAISFVYNTLMEIVCLWKNFSEKQFGDNTLKGGSVALENNPALLGVGYIVGPHISSVMMAGGVLSSLVLIPIISYFGGLSVVPLAPEMSTTIAEMSSAQIRGSYLLYIGAGALVAGGLMSAARSLPVILDGLRNGWADWRGGANETEENAPRTDRDLPMRWVVAGILAIIAAIVLSPPLEISGFSNPWIPLVGTALILVLGFLFVTVSARVTGEVGSSVNPISGMTLATLLITCLVFLALGWTASNPYFVTALSIGAIVGIAATIGGTTAQALKTGFLVGATPRSQQIAILVGTLGAALAISPLLVFFNNSQTYYQPVASSSELGRACVPESWLAPNGQYKTATIGGDPALYYIWYNADPQIAQVGKYLVNERRNPVYFVDPGINGTIRKDENGNDLVRFDAPKATLFSFVIKGTLLQEFSWGLFLIGAMIALTFRLSGAPALAFAVGLYLPFSTGAPIFVGGVLRYLADIYLRRKAAADNLSEEEALAESDKSNGVLLASGYIVGGALAGIFVAAYALFPTLSGLREPFRVWAENNNPFFGGENSDLLSLLPFLVLSAILFFVGRERLLRGRDRDDYPKTMSK